jgi:hypothetical protein
MVTQVESASMVLAMAGHDLQMTRIRETTVAARTSAKNRLPLTLSLPPSILGLSLFHKVALDRNSPINPPGRATMVGDIDALRKEDIDRQTETTVRST